MRYFLHEAGVGEVFRRSGVGGELREHARIAEHVADAHGLRTIAAFVRLYNGGFAKKKKKRGWARVKIQGEKVMHKSDAPLAALTSSKPLRIAGLSSILRPSSYVSMASA
jgi:hypothetical protein